jgi:hypothetical protein
MPKPKRSNSSISYNEELDESEELKQKSTSLFEIKNEKYFMFYFAFHYILNTFKVGLSLYGVYLLWILLHYGASHLYVEYCVPRTWVGVIISPLLTSTPHCQGLRWIIYNGGNQINNMWITIGSWICVKLVI